MKISEHSVLVVIDMQGGDMSGGWAASDDPAAADVRAILPNVKRTLDVFRAKKFPVIHLKEVHRKEMVDFGRELDGSEGVHLLDSSPDTDYNQLTYPIDGEFTITKRRYSGFFGTDLEILLKGLKAQTLFLVGGFTNICVHYTAVDAHQNDYHFKVVVDAVSGSSREEHDAALRAMKYLQRDCLITTADVESALSEP